MKFLAEDLEELACEEEHTTEAGLLLKVVSQEESAGKHDCTYTHMVFSAYYPDDETTKFYEFGYECSYNHGIMISEYSCGPEECRQVEPYEVTVTKYRTVA